MIRLSTKGRYATRIMARLATANGTKPLQKKQLAAHEGISPDYVEQILTRLKSAGMVRSHRGVSGGFSLLADPEKTTVADVVESVEGPMILVPCEEEDCDRVGVCVTRPIWQAATRAMRDVLAASTIAELAKSIKHAEASAPAMYQI